MKKSPFTKKVGAIEVKKSKSISKLLLEMSQTGFQGRRLAEAFNVLEKMVKDKSLTLLMGYAGSLSTTAERSKSSA